MLRIGEVRQINRFPVKSMAGERLDGIRVERCGLYGDRSHAFIDESKEGWSRYFTARQIPRMLLYRAKFADSEGNGEFPPVKITSPDERIFGWDEELLQEMQAFASRKMSMIRYRPEDSNLLAVDAASVSIVLDASLHRLEQRWGQRLDDRRFRANFVVAVERPLDEIELVGKRLRIGDAQLSIDMPCERCSMIGIDPETLHRDPSLFRVVNETTALNFGLYGSVVKAGEVRLGDSVFVA